VVLSAVMTASCREVLVMRSGSSKRPEGGSPGDAPDERCAHGPPGLDGVGGGKDEPCWTIPRGIVC
jgi:hypothetical protein